MKKIVKTAIITLILVLSIYHYSGAESWEKVVEQGFGDPGNDYAWSMASFKGKLYVGTLNVLNGAQIWSSSSGEVGCWQKVYNSRSGIRSNMGIRYLYADGSKALYACTSNLKGAEVLRTVNGRRWIKVIRRGLGNWRNGSVRCMVRFKDFLYGGAGNNGAQLVRSKNGFNWRLVNTNPSLDSTKVFDPATNNLISNNIMIGELVVFNDQLYAFTWTKDLKPDLLLDQLKVGLDKPVQFPTSPGAFEVWRSDNGINWEKVVGQNDHYGNGMGFCLRDPAGLENDIVTSTAVFKGRLYLGTENELGKTAIWRTDEGTEWEKVLDFPKDLGEMYNVYVWRMIPFKGRLFVGTLNQGLVGTPGVTGAQIWASDSGDRETFYNLVHNGFDGKTWVYGPDYEIPKNCGIRSFGILNDTLFAGTATPLSTLVPQTILINDIGCEVWKMLP